MHPTGFVSKGRAVVLLGVLAFWLSACGASDKEVEDIKATTIADTIAEVTEDAPTPAPTVTPLDPGPAKKGVWVDGIGWRVQAVSLEPIEEFGTWAITSTDGAEPTDRMLKLDIEYECTNPDGCELSPESIVLMHMGEQGIKGWAKLVALYQGEGSSEVRNLEQSSFVLGVDEGDTRRESFVYSFREDYTDFRLLFPGCPPIDLVVDQ